MINAKHASPSSDLFKALSALPAAQLTVANLKQHLANFHAQQIADFHAGLAIESLINGRSDFIDLLLQRLWDALGLNNDKTLTLIAVGGYGRGELHPFSDIDILILTAKTPSENQTPLISDFLTQLWDLNLTVGHSVRTLAACLAESHDDLTVMTNLIEARFLVGDKAQFQQLQQAVFHHPYWQAPTFFAAKRQEQKTRHARYHSTSYKLEPDIKNSPGGLRDIHILQWISLRYFGAISIEDMLEKQYITPEELDELTQCRRFLWRIRFALHLIVTRQDNRLLFDRQLQVAQLLGYSGEGNMPVEKMMKAYYRAVHNINELNQLLLQVIDENQDVAQRGDLYRALDADFHCQNDLITPNQPALFYQQPDKLLTLFYWLANDPTLVGIHSDAIRQLRLARRQLTSPLCKNRKARDTFMAILRHPNGIRRALLLMHRHDILSAYLPEWRNIAGLMQFDLFHSYTVDEHTIKLLLNIEQFKTNTTENEKIALCRQCYQQLDKPELLIIAGLFHDIGKGQQGDHAEIGAQAVAHFAKQHGLSAADTQNVVWLVARHLLMSMTAQGQDIQDQDVILEFAQHVRDQNRLNYLLCLTVADMSATNETLWNGWRQSLLDGLYHATSAYFAQAHAELPDRRKIARQHRLAALQILTEHNPQQDVSPIKTFWRRCRLDYFHRHTPAQLAWHATALLTAPITPPCVFIRPNADHGGTEIFIYAPDRPFLFAIISQVLDARNLMIHDAQIFTNKDGMAMDTFIVLEPNGQPLSETRHLTVQHSLEKSLKKEALSPRKIRKLPAKLKHFHVPTQIQFLPSHEANKTYVELIALDRPGLLACVAEVFATLQLSLQSAKITTIGERVEDLFILSDINRKALSDALCAQLKLQLLRAIDLMDAVC